MEMNNKLAIWVGGLDIWDPLMKGIVTSGYPDSNPKPPIQTTNLPLVDLVFKHLVFIPGFLGIRFLLQWHACAGFGEA